MFHVNKLIKYLQNDYRTKHDKKITTSTILKVVSELKNFFNWLIENDAKSFAKPNINPFDNVVFKGIFNKNTDIIPESVIEKILFYLPELREDIQRIVLIMLNCGLRFKEVKYLEEDCVFESTGDYKILKYIPYKVLEARRIRGLDDYHRIIIDDELYNEILNQIEFTKELREKYNTNEIFLELGVNENLGLIENSKYCNTIQKLINEHNITDDSGQIWKISSKQFRKTLAVSMITDGNANENEVGDYLGHLNYDTTKKYYAEVDKMKLSEMDSEFFYKKFQLTLEEKQLEGFSEEERKKLYIDFCLNNRDVEHGVCTRPYGEKPCKRRGDIFACATCSKICFNPKHYKRWYDIFEKQSNRVQYLKKTYESKGINPEEYMSFREYEKEIYHFDSLKAVIDKIEGEKNGNCRKN